MSSRLHIPLLSGMVGMLVAMAGVAAEVSPVLAISSDEV